MLEVAERRFAEKGYDGAHLESIASEVGVRKTALYYYFASKEDLYVAVLERILLEFDRTITSALETNRPTVERLHALSRS
jgi:TetR/AcrR family transcriptional regulator